MTSPSFAVITPSYRPDFERARLLCDTIDRHFVTPVTHYIIVDARSRADSALFAQLQSPHRRILHKHDILPRWIHRVPGFGKFWFSWRTRPIRGWIFQQLAKIATAAQMSEDYAIFADSDTAFVRPVDCERVFLDGGRLRLYSEPGGNPAHMPEHSQWHRTASALLGLDDTPMPAPDYIENVTSWRRDNVVRLCRHIESVTGRHWVAALAGHWSLSEYILYGAFVERVLGPANGHFADARKLCLAYWSNQPMNDAQMQAFMGEMQPWQVAVMLSARAGMSPARYARLLDMVPR